MKIRLQPGIIGQRVNDLLRPYGRKFAPDPASIKSAMVGGIDFKSWKYDKVTAMRQPGSTFKLFVYTEAMNQGLTPCDKRRDEYISMQVYDKVAGKEVTWAPTNANGSFSAPVCGSIATNAQCMK